MVFGTVNTMSSRSSKILLVPALFAAFVAGTHTASAAVMPVGASFEVSAQVVASCDVETGSGAVTAARTAVTCGGGQAAMVDGTSEAALSNPTAEEAAAPAGTNAVLVTY